jgi:multicomponent Na+:H+ antiporter subunit G
MIDALAVLLIVLGTAFLAVSAIGLIRFPDFWIRAHAVAKAETLGLVLLISGFVVHHRFGSGTFQLVMIAIFSLLLNPTAIHALARTATRQELETDLAERDRSREELT